MLLILLYAHKQNPDLICMLHLLNLIYAQCLIMYKDIDGILCSYTGFIWAGFVHMY